MFLREATNAHNLVDLVPALTRGNGRRVALCTDDRQPPDLLDDGGIDSMLRTLVAEGIDPLDALRMATLNPAEYFNLGDRGAIGPGRRADLVIAPDLESFQAEAVYSGGALVAVDGLTHAWSEPPDPTPPRPSMEVDWPALSLDIPAREGSLRVIRAIPDQIVTGSEIAIPAVREGRVVADPERDLLKVAVLERHHGTGRVAVGLVAGLGLERGAIAGTVAHDHHNLIVVGADDESMVTAARQVAHTEGGSGRCPRDRGAGVSRPPRRRLDVDRAHRGHPSAARRRRAGCPRPRITASRPVHGHVVPGARGDPVPQDHRPGPRGRGRLPARLPLALSSSERTPGTRVERM